MTCIVGLVHKGEVWMGGDSASNGNWITRISSLPKVFMVHDMLIGITGNWRLAQLLQYHLPAELDAWDGAEDYMQYLVLTFVPAVRKLFKEEGFSKEDNNQQSYYGAYMIGHAGQLYTVESNYQVVQHVDGYTAVGSGAELALGALYVLGEKTAADKRIEMALEAAAYFSNGVERPFHIQCLKKAG